MPPADTLAVAPNRMPFGLTRKIWPLEVNEPKISEALLPSTRFSATAEAEGCWNTTELPAPIEKLCQFRIAFCEPWFTSSELAAGLEIVADPAATWPPVGRAWACTGANAD